MPGRASRPSASTPRAWGASTNRPWNKSWPQFPSSLHLLFYTALPTHQHQLSNCGFDAVYNPYQRSSLSLRKDSHEQTHAHLDHLGPGLAPGLRRPTGAQYTMNDFAAIVIEAAGETQHLKVETEDGTVPTVAGVKPAGDGEWEISINHAVVYEYTASIFFPADLNLRPGQRRHGVFLRRVADLL